MERKLSLFVSEHYFFIQAKNLQPKRSIRVFLNLNKKYTYHFHVRFVSIFSLQFQVSKYKLQWHAKAKTKSL